MTAQVATVVRCADRIDLLYATLTSVERQIAGAGEIVLVIDPSTPPAAREWIAALARARGALTVDAPSARPGAVRNAGVAATSAPQLVCLDAGDRLDPRANELWCRAAEADPEVDIFTSWICVRGPGSSERVVAPAGWSLAHLLDDPAAIHPASLFTRRAWLACAGFDESLPALEDYEFWLRVLERGGRCEMIEQPLLVRRLRPGAWYRRALEPDLHGEAMRAVVARHSASFGSDPARVLYFRELQLQDLAGAFQTGLDRRDAGVRELAALAAEANGLEAALGPDRRQAVDPGDLARTTPVSRDWGFDRGLPVDRYYVERFLERHACDIRGAVLEVQDPDYTTRFGGDRVTRSDVVDLFNMSNPRATIVSDLRAPANIASNTYDCIILTQTLHVIDDIRAVVAECGRILKPGGVLLATLPCASRVCLEYGDEGDFWRVTAAGARRLFEEAWPDAVLEVRSQGNVRTNAAFLYGLASHELTAAELDADDPYFPLVVTVRAEKAARPERPPLAPRRLHRGEGTGAILLYHRVGDAGPDIHNLSVSRDEFRGHMSVLRERYWPMALDELLAAARDGRIPDGAVAVTFDDGYVDNLTAASPVLSTLGIPATFFVTTDRLGDEYEFWWDRLERALLTPEAVAAELLVELPGGPVVFPTATAEQRTGVYWRVYHAIVGLAAGARDRVVEIIVGWSGVDARVPADRRRMRRDEILALARREGHAIGAHSATHVALPCQPGAVQREEIEGSRQTLEAVLGGRVTAFAYPFGAVSAEVVEATRAASYAAAVTCAARPIDGRVDPLLLPRYEVKRQPAAEFGAWLARRLSTASS